MGLRDVAETLQAYEDQAQARCMGTLKQGACILDTECCGKCQLREEASKPSSPFACRPLTDEQREQVQGEADEARAEEREARHQRNHPEDYV